MTLYAITVTALLAFSVLCNCVYASVHAEDAKTARSLRRQVLDLKARQLVMALDLRMTRRARDAARAGQNLTLAMLAATPVLPYADDESEPTPIHDALRGVA